MSKYTDLCAAYAASARLYAEYRAECEYFADALVEHLTNYLQCPPSSLEFISPPEEAMAAGLPEIIAPGLYMDDEAFCHLDLSLTLENPRAPQQTDTIAIHIMFKKSGECFDVSLAEPWNAFEIFGNSAEDFEPFFEFITGIALDEVSNSFAYWLKQDKTPVFGYVGQG